ncbi:MAG: DUF4198 domain-containing protein [Lysobacteraceae bacterium]
MKRLTLVLAIATTVFAGTFAGSASAHKAWLRPSATVLAGNAPWVTVDAAVSNDLFYFNHVPLRLDNLQITAPDGSQAEPQNPATGKYRSVFDVELKQEGTYRIAIRNEGLFARWEENGEPRRWRGNAETFAKEVPKDAKGLEVTESSGRNETFVTNGAPTTTALKTDGKGLELHWLTHPNDLYAGEAANFRFTIDGKPAAGLDIEVVRGGTRYRDAQDEIKLKTDADGNISITWPQAGMYWLETSLSDNGSSLPQATSRRFGYVATLEVLPQ